MKSKIRQYVVDAFAGVPFRGNPAAVCLLDEWPSETLMRSIAAENNLSETAFAVPDGAAWGLRFFTPSDEIDFCGHATLGAAFAVLRLARPGADSVRFLARRGELVVRRAGDAFEMDFPAYEPRPLPVDEAMVRALGGVRPVAAARDRDLLFELEDEDAVRAFRPDGPALAALDATCVAITARARPGGGYDCVSRVFAPRIGIPEDPVTGSTHCLIAPYWSRRLGRSEIRAFQASARTGSLVATVDGPRVRISARAVLFSTAELEPVG